MITEGRAKDICNRYLSTTGDCFACDIEDMRVFPRDYKVCVVDTYENKVYPYTSWVDMFRKYVFNEILYDFSDYISFTDIEEYLGDDNYDWFVHEYADMLKVSVDKS